MSCLLLSILVCLTTTSPQWRVHRDTFAEPNIPGGNSQPWNTLPRLIPGGQMAWASPKPLSYNRQPWASFSNLRPRNTLPTLIPMPSLCGSSGTCVSAPQQSWNTLPKPMSDQPSNLDMSNPLSEVKLVLWLLPMTWSAPVVDPELHST